MAVDFKKKLEELKARQAAEKKMEQPEQIPVVETKKADTPVQEVKSISTEPVVETTPEVQLPVLSPNSPGFLLKQKVGELNEAMLSNHPRMPVLLKEIWLAVRKQPEQVTVLSPEETHTIFQGIERQTGIFLATSVTESKSKTGTSSKMAALKKLGADAF